MEKKKLKGSFTIEAAYLLPFIFFLIWNVLYLAFFLYDQSTVLQGSYSTALRTERCIDTPEGKKEEAEEKFTAVVKKKVVCAEVTEEKEIEKDYVTVRTGLTVQGPAGALLQSSWKGTQEQTAEGWTPVAFIRNCRKAENIRNLLQTGNG